MECIDFGFQLEELDQLLIVKSLRYAKKNLTGVLASQSEFDHVLSLFPNFG